LLRGTTVGRTKAVQQYGWLAVSMQMRTSAVLILEDIAALARGRNVDQCWRHQITSSVQAANSIHDIHADGHQNEPSDSRADGGGPKIVRLCRAKRECGSTLRAAGAAAPNRNCRYWAARSLVKDVMLLDRNHQSVIRASKNTDGNRTRRIAVFDQTAERRSWTLTGPHIGPLRRRRS